MQLLYIYKIQHQPAVQHFYLKLQHVVQQVGVKFHIHQQFLNQKGKQNTTNLAMLMNGHSKILPI